MSGKTPAASKKATERAEDKGSASAYPDFPARLFGHDAACETLTRAWHSGRMPHAWVITGVEGIGKTALALHLAAFVLADGRVRLGMPDGEHPTVRMVAAGTHPDLRVVARPYDEKTGVLKATISIDSARKIPPFLSLTPSLSSWRVVVISEAHCLTPEAQNALLKGIEEPPTRTLIVLCTTSLGLVLPTIRSRCRVLPLAPLSSFALQAAFSQALGRDDATVPEVVRHTKNVRLALTVAGMKEIETLYTNALRLLDPNVPLDSRLYGVASTLAAKKDQMLFPLLMDLLGNTLAQALKAHARGTPLPEGLPSWMHHPRAVPKLLIGCQEVAEITQRATASTLDAKVCFLDAVHRVRGA